MKNPDIISPYQPEKYQKYGSESKSRSKTSSSSSSEITVKENNPKPKKTRKRNRSNSLIKLKKMVISKNSSSNSKKNVSNLNAKSQSPEQNSKNLFPTKNIKVNKSQDNNLSTNVSNCSLVSNRYSYKQMQKIQSQVPLIDVQEILPFPDNNNNNALTATCYTSSTCLESLNTPSSFNNFNSTEPFSQSKNYKIFRQKSNAKRRCSDVLPRTSTNKNIKDKITTEFGKPQRKSLSSQFERRTSFKLANLTPIGTENHKIDKIESHIRIQLCKSNASLNTISSYHTCQTCERG